MTTSADMDEWVTLSMRYVDQLSKTHTQVITLSTGSYIFISASSALFAVIKYENFS